MIVYVNHDIIYRTLQAVGKNFVNMSTRAPICSLTHMSVYSFTHMSLRRTASSTVDGDFGVVGLAGVLRSLERVAYIGMAYIVMADMVMA